MVNGEKKMKPPEDIKDRSFAFATRIVRLCVDLEASPGVSRTLGNQLLRAGTSIGANVEEAHGSQSKPDFISKMSIATKEARETNYWLRLLAASEIVSAVDLADITDESHQLVAILTIVKRSRENPPFLFHFSPFAMVSPFPFHSSLFAPELVKG